MDRVVRVMTRCDEVLGVENIRVTVYDILNRHWIHVMNNEPIKYLMVAIS